MKKKIKVVERTAVKNRRISNYNIFTSIITLPEVFNSV